MTLISFNGFAQVVIGTTDPKTTIDVNGSLLLRERTALTFIYNNQNISLGANVYSHYRTIGPTAVFNIRTFLTSGEDGPLLTFIYTTDSNPIYYTIFKKPRSSSSF